MRVANLNSLLTADLDPIFWTPERLGKPSAWWGHVPFAFWLIAACKPRLFVELGVHYGVSYAAFCEAVARLRLETRCYGVDTWVGDAQAGFYGDEIYNELKDFHDHRYASFSELLRKSFDEALGSFADGTIDLLHIDGYHAYEAVRHDFETWRPKLSERAVALFHDTNVRRDDFGVWQFFGELKRELPNFEFLHCHGLGVVAVGAEAPAAVTELCALTREMDVAAARERFSYFGARWMTAAGESVRNFELAARLRQVEDEVARGEAQIAQGEADRAQAKENVEALAARLRQGEGSLAEKDARIAQLQGDLSQTKATADALAARLRLAEGSRAEKDGRIGQLEGDLSQAKANLDGLAAGLRLAEALLAEKDGRIAQLEGDRRQAEENADALAARLRLAEASLAEKDAQGVQLEGDRTQTKEDADALAARLRLAEASLAEKNAEIAQAGKTIAGLSDRYASLKRGEPKRGFLRFRKARARPRLPASAVPEAYEAIRASAFFDPDFYLEANPDVGAAGMAPALHYLLHGGSEGRNPGPFFSTRGYLDQNPDVAAAGMNALVHYELHGRGEGRALPPAPEGIDREVDHSGKNPGPRLRRSGGFERWSLGMLNAFGPRGASKRTPRYWYYIGDTLGWLEAHSQLTGVGRVSTELFFASRRRPGETPVLPCILGRSSSGLVAMSDAGRMKFLAEKTGRSIDEATADAGVPPSADAGSPQSGDHVFFTGLVWTPTFVDLFQRLADRNIEFSVLVFDIIPLENVELVGEANSKLFSAWLATTLNTAKFVYVSNTIVKEQIIRWAFLSGQVVKAQIIVIAYGHRATEGALSRSDIANCAQTAAVDVDAFVLSVGTIDARKNQTLLCRTWKELTQRVGLDRLPQLVLAGRDDIGLAEADPALSALFANRKIIILQGLSDAHVAGLYKASLFTAFPSVSEGYGLPVAESLQYGKLCLSSNLPVVREHAGDLIWYFDPNRFDEAVGLFLRAIERPEEREQAEARIAREFQPRKWADTFQTMIDAASPHFSRG